MQLRDYAAGGWWFVVACRACGRQTRVEPQDLLARYPCVDPGMRLADLARHLRCRDCRRRQARLDAVPRLPTQAFVGGMI